MKFYEEMAQLEKVAIAARDLARLLDLSVISPIAIQSARKRLQQELNQLPSLLEATSG